MDGLGSSLSLTNSSGAIQTEYSYDAFGKSASSGQSVDNSSQYRGEENDGTGLQHDGAGYYDPTQHRLISESPFSLDNAYPYVGNSPMNGRGPAGRQIGPVNYFRDPFSVDHWMLNGGINTVEDLIMLDRFAEWSWVVGDHCRPTTERACAGVKIIATVILMVSGGEIFQGGAGAALEDATVNATRAAPTLNLDVDLLAEYGTRVPTESDGFLNVVTHSDAQAAAVLRDGEWISVSHRSLARFISGNPGYDGQAVRLIGCNAGSCATGLGENLANKLGVRVLAPTDVAWVTPAGTFWSSGWRLFTPRGP